MAAATAPRWTLFLDRENRVWDETWRLLGGSEGGGPKPDCPWDVQCRARRGVPDRALTQLLGCLEALDLSQVVQRFRNDAERSERDGSKGCQMTPALAERVWQVTQVLARSTVVQGSQRAARAWLLTPARGLDAARPVELLTTAQGTEAVLKHLQRLALNAYV